MATPIERALVLGLCTMALVGQVVQLDTVFWNALGAGGPWAGTAHPAYAAVVAADAVLTGVMVAVALLLAFHRGNRRSARALAMAVAVWGYLLGYPGLIRLLRPDGGSGLLPLLFRTHFLVVEILGLAALLRFAALFPRVLHPSDLRDPATLPPGIEGLQRLRLLLLRPAVPWAAAAAFAGLALAANAVLRDPPEGTLLALVDLARFSALSVVVLNLRRSYLLATDPQREAARWLAVGFAVLVGSLGALMGAHVLTAVTGWRVAYFNWRPLVLDLGLLGLLAGATMGVFYRGPVRSGPAARRVVLVSALLLLTLLLAAALEVLFSDALLARLSLPRGVGTLLATMTATALSLRYGDLLGRLLEASVRTGRDAVSDERWVSPR